VKSESSKVKRNNNKSESQPRTAIFIPVHIDSELLLNYTTQCLDSINRNTHRTDVDIIVVDNGSPGRPSFRLDSFDITTIKLEENRGFAAAVNAGIGALSPEHRAVVVMNNDILVPPDWLETLEQYTYRADIIGCVSNVASGKQEAVGSYAGGYEEWAVAYREKHSGELELYPRVAFYCTYIKRAAIEKTGLLDTRFGTGSFEDDDFCLRAQKEGFRTGIARDLFVHHYGHRTFKSLGVDLPTLQKTNEKLFIEKWGDSLRGTIYADLLRDPLEELYLGLAARPSDINEHMPVLREYAKKANHVTEFGVRGGNSTIALISGRPRRMVSYDVIRFRNAGVIQQLASGTDYEFRRADVLLVEIEETDLLFIDTFHTFGQLTAELQRHAGKVKKSIMLHDTETFGRTGEDGSPGGLMDAIEEFIKTSPEWSIERHFTNNNGLTILARG